MSRLAWNKPATQGHRCQQYVFARRVYIRSVGLSVQAWEIGCRSGEEAAKEEGAGHWNEPSCRPAMRQIAVYLIQILVPSHLPYCTVT